MLGDNFYLLRGVETTNSSYQIRAKRREDATNTEKIVLFEDSTEKLQRYFNGNLYISKDQYYFYLIFSMPNESF